MSSRPVTLDMSTSVPVKPVTLDMSTSIPLTKPSAEDQASQTRQMLVGGLTGMPTPNMTAEDRASFERGKAAGAVSVPVVAAGTAGLTATPAVVTAIADMAEAHPVAAAIIKKALTLAGGAEALKHGRWILDMLP